MRVLIKRTIKHLKKMIVFLRRLLHLSYLIYKSQSSYVLSELSCTLADVVACGTEGA